MLGFDDFLDKCDVIMDPLRPDNIETPILKRLGIIIHVLMFILLTLIYWIGSLCYGMYVILLFTFSMIFEILLIIPYTLIWVINGKWYGGKIINWFNINHSFIFEK